MGTVAKSLMGGPSAFCISTGQLENARHLANDDPQTAERIQSELARLEQSFSRNERAALAFVLIERLRESRNAI
ncbi:MAG: hypothetical protein JXX29_21020 [Deltaproteobacteria bacterium]|nr:hypothetical protein [Deltaproteobacteria bacterium]MBN2674177.1 hypothetical protein [Deltaproteobacteria bacterium]